MPRLRTVLCRGPEAAGTDQEDCWRCHDVATGGSPRLSLTILPIGYTTKPFGIRHSLVLLEERSRIHLKMRPCALSRVSLEAITV